MRDRFARFAAWVTQAAGSPIVTGAAFGLVGVWLVGGLVGGFTDTWQLLINTVTTIITFLMVFLIQANINRTERVRDAQLAEVVHAAEAADNTVIDAAQLSEAQLTALLERQRAYARETPDGH